MIATGIAVILWFGFYVWYFLSYNHLVALRNTVSQAWAHVDVELQRRFDLIGNLVQVVKGYAAHEADTLLQTVRTRQQHTNAGQQDVNLAQQHNQQDAQLLGNIMLLVEQYPNLKADQQFITLQQALVETENRIANRRSAYNECVSRYEIYRHSIPALVIAWAGHFDRREFFDAQEQTAQAIKVVLS